MVHRYHQQDISFVLRGKEEISKKTFPLSSKTKVKNSKWGFALSLYDKDKAS